MSLMGRERRVMRVGREGAQRAARTQSRAGERGLTLLEILVAMAIFSILGATLALFLRQGLKTWRTGEARRELFEDAQAILSQLRDDLRATFTAVPSVPGAPSRARFLCDHDAQGRGRLTLVRTIAGEARHPIAALAGNAVGADADMDGVDDRAAAVAGRLRATGGLMEVLWAFDPTEDGVLLRGTRAPALTEEASLFSLETISTPERLRRVAHPISGRVLALDLLLWTPVTRSWDTDTPPRPVAPPGGRSGPARTWDSTRGLLPPEASGEAGFPFWKGEASVDDPEDDIFPERVRVTLVLREDGPSAVWSALSVPMSSGDAELRVFNAAPFEGKDKLLRVGSGASAEWVKVKSLDPQTGQIRLESGGRGQRGTKPRAHAAGEDVVIGNAFSAEIELPSGGESWRE